MEKMLPQCMNADEYPKLSLKELEAYKREIRVISVFKNAGTPGGPIGIDPFLYTRMGQIE